MRGLGDRYLLSLWRQAVLKKWGGKCFFCENRNKDDLECHHLKKRKHKLTRYLAENGVPVCRFGCHQKADTFAGQDMIRRRIGDEAWLNLDRLASQVIKQWCLEHGISQNEYLQARKDDLLKIIKA